MSARRLVQAEQLPTVTVIEDSNPLSDSMPVESPPVTKAIAELLDAIRASSPAANLDLVSRAANFAISAHAADLRRSGEPYVIHPIAVASILAKIHLDSETIAAALLHDVVEDTEISLETIRTEFGQRVALLVDGVSKLGRIHWPSDQTDGARSREKAH